MLSIIIVASDCLVVNAVVLEETSFAIGITIIVTINIVIAIIITITIHILL